MVAAGTTQPPTRTEQLRQRARDAWAALTGREQWILVLVLSLFVLGLLLRSTGMFADTGAALPVR